MFFGSSLHPRGTDQPHISTLKTLGRDVTRAPRQAYPKGKGSSYNEVHELLLYWEANDLDTYKEIIEPQQIFGNTILFSVEQWNIPNFRSGNKLKDRIVAFREDYDYPLNLLIVYYGGQGAPNKTSRSVWIV